ncbi:MAG: RNA polymerase sporulation sigma factor SigK [Anaerostipes sp.]|nr:RNA polymerase sporulation sigma factor SigK [Anaerostipes sp.]
MQTFLNPFTQEEEQHYLKLSQLGDINARNLLVEHNLRLVAHIVKKYYNYDRDKEDLISVGTIGLIKAINTFNMEKKSRLVTYAARCIENEILMLLRQEKKCSKDTSIYDPIGIDKEGNEINLLDILGTYEENIVEQLEQKEQVLVLYHLLNQMKPSREKTTLIYRYGLYGLKPKTQKEVAKILGISRSYVSRIEKKGISILSEMMMQRETHS